MEWSKTFLGDELPNDTYFQSILLIQRLFQEYLFRAQYLEALCAIEEVAAIKIHLGIVCCVPMQMSRKFKNIVQRRKLELCTLIILLI